MIASDATALPELRRRDLDDVLDRVASDKKHGRDFYALVLSGASGSVVLERQPRTDETLARVRHAIERVVESFG